MCTCGNLLPCTPEPGASAVCPRGHPEHVQGNCKAPFTQAQQQAWGLPEALAAGLRQLKPFQCVLATKESLFTVWKGNVWLDNLHVALARQPAAEALAEEEATLVEASQLAAGAKGSNLYLTNMTLQGDGRPAARAVALMVDPSAQRETRWPSFHHSLLLQGAPPSRMHEPHAPEHARDTLVRRSMHQALDWYACGESGFR